MPDCPEDRQHTGFGAAPDINSISAVTLATHDMARAVRFYRSLGFSLRYGGEDSAFTSFYVGSSYLNLIGQPKDRQWSWWGRVIFYVSDVKAGECRILAPVAEGETEGAVKSDRASHVVSC